ncbi:MAG: DUF6516 family protein [Gammaproteobacteria bacterium]|nr:DUF6516 family protein [Gammaproteobacteria bacterium]
MFDDGSWVKFEAKKVDATPGIPHGVRYSLTLHDSNNTRILGYDNAHAIKPKRRKKFGAKRVVWDHKHQKDDVNEYHFDSAGQLMEDFWKDVDEVLGYGD